MIVIKLRQHFFHNGLTEKHSLGRHAELVTILSYCCHLAVIEIDYLPVTADESLFLSLQIFRVNSSPSIFLLFCHS